MNAPAIRRKARRTSWTVVDNGVIRDTRLGFDALGLLVYLLSKPDDWTARAGELQARGGIGRHAFHGIMRQLSEAGYASLEPVRGQDGRVSGRAWVVSEDASPTDGFSDGRIFRRSDFPTVGKPAPIVSTETLLSTETAPSTENVVVVQPPAAARQPSQRDDDDGQAGMLAAITEALAPEPCTNAPARARRVLAAIRQLAPEASELDVERAAGAFLAKLRRQKGGSADPITAGQLPGIVQAYLSRQGEGIPTMALVPHIER